MNGTPTTSIVMPVHGQWPIVRRALEALETHTDGVELIVVDDASPDETVDRIDAQGQGTVLRNSTNVGFGAACNQGAAHARGRFVCFLNSDAIVHPGWLPPLERALDDDDVGAAAPLLLNEDGSLQEAGGSVGRDGVTFPLGRGSQPDDSTWSFRREIDYGSAACLVVRRSRFEALGGFDSAYQPAYYEDVDFCLRLAEHGFRTMLEPESAVTHVQYGSGSFEGARSLVNANRATFLDRWSRRLDDRPVVTGSRVVAHRLLALRDAVAVVRFLVIGDESLAGRLATRWRNARVTLVGATTQRGIEAANPPDLASWLDERRFHYSAVFAPDESLHEALRRSQPQAVRIHSDDDRLVEHLVEAGIQPDSDARG